MGADIRSGVLALLERPEAAHTHPILSTYIQESKFSWFAEGLGFRESLKHGMRKRIIHVSRSR